MNEERRLIALGYPLDEAICMCHAMRRDGSIREFLRHEESKPTKCRNCKKDKCDGLCRV